MINRKITTGLTAIVLVFLIAGTAFPQGPEEDIMKLFKEYYEISKKIYTPQAEGKKFTPDDIKATEKLRREAGVYWIPRATRTSTITRDFNFLRNNIKAPYVLGSVQMATDFARLTITYELAPDGKNKFAQKNGEYEFTQTETGWKISKFQIVIPKPVYPVPESSSIDVVLEAYFKKMQSIYPPGDTKGQRGPSLTSARSNTQAFWKLKERDITTPSMKSAILFNLYRPSKWEILDIKESGDFARTDVTMEVGNPLQIKLKNGPFSKSVRYTLVKDGGNWYITGFEEIKE
ncbi:hypothetical protein ACFLT9_13085 [Acidobacteriota bacterium]